MLLVSLSMRNAQLPLSQIVFAILYLHGASVEAFARDTQVQLDVGAYVSRGDYGNTEATKIAFLPLSLRVQLGRSYLKLNSGWAEINGPGNVDTQEKSDSTRRTRGLGDTYLAAGHSWFTGATLPLDWLTGEVKLKFPTADASQGLGTGKFDYLLSVSGYRPLGRLALHGTLMYRWRTSPINTALLNTGGVSLGVIYLVTARLSLGTQWEVHQSSTSSGARRNELMPYVSVRLAPDVSLMFYTQIGFADGSPDRALGTQVGYRF